MAHLVDSRAGRVIRLEVVLKVRLLLLTMMIRLEMFLMAPARGWGHGCLNLNVLV